MRDLIAEPEAGGRRVSREMSVIQVVAESERNRELAAGRARERPARGCWMSSSYARVRDE